MKHFFGSCFKIQLFGYYWVARVLCMLWTQSIVRYITLRYFFPICGLSYHFLNSIFWSTETLISGSHRWYTTKNSAQSKNHEGLLPCVVAAVPWVQPHWWSVILLCLFLHVAQGRGLSSCLSMWILSPRHWAAEHPSHGHNRRICFWTPSHVLPINPMALVRMPPCPDHRGFIGSSKSESTSLNSAL